MKKNLNDINENCKLVFSEKFDKYEIGPFSEKITAVRESHYIEPNIYQGPWISISAYHTDSKPNINIQWHITEYLNRKVLKQTGFNKEGVINLKYYLKKYLFHRKVIPFLFLPCIINNELNLKNLKINLQLIPLSKAEYFGIVFRFINSMQHYIFAIKNNKAYLLKRSFNSLIKLKSKPIIYQIEKKLTLSLIAFEDEISCFVNNTQVFSLSDDSYENGKCGIVSNVPAMFLNFNIFTDIYKAKDSNNSYKKTKIKKDTPGFRLIKSLDLPSNPTGRSIRFGALANKNSFDFLIAQGIHPVKDNINTITLTAVDHEGNMLWEKGKQRQSKNIFPPDVPVQIYDIDNDGNNEVICEYGKYLQILDGKTGEIKNQTVTPRYLDTKNPKLNILDSICICNLSGHDRPNEFIIKDMYSNLYAYDNQLNLLWHYYGNTGHFPFVFDINGDGKDEILCGYSLINSNGKKIWELKLNDHADAVAIIKSDIENKFFVAIAASNEGFIFADINGKIIKQLRIGHMQTITVAKLLPGIEDYQIATNTFWGNPGVIYILDFNGNILHCFQPSINGSPIAPVRWTKDRQSYILLSASTGKRGGLYDGYGNQVVSFPDDNHPNLCYYTSDIDYDGLDEIVCYDHNRLNIYHSEEIGPIENKESIKHPLSYNQSNYRSNIFYF